MIPELKIFFFSVGFVGNFLLWEKNFVLQSPLPWGSVKDAGVVPKTDFSKNRFCQKLILPKIKPLLKIFFFSVGFVGNFLLWKKISFYNRHCLGVEDPGVEDFFSPQVSLEIFLLMGKNFGAELDFGATLDFGAVFAFGATLDFGAEFERFGGFFKRSQRFPGEGFEGSRDPLRGESFGFRSDSLLLDLCAFRSASIRFRAKLVLGLFGVFEASTDFRGKFPELPLDLALAELEKIGLADFWAFGRI